MSRYVATPTKLRSLVLAGLVASLLTSCEAGRPGGDGGVAGNGGPPRPGSPASVRGLDDIPVCGRNEPLTYDNFGFAVGPDDAKTASSEAGQPASPTEPAGRYAERWFSATYPDAIVRGARVRREPSSPKGSPRFSLVHRGSPKIAIELIELPTGELAVDSQVGCARFMADSQRDVPAPAGPP